MTKGHLLSGFGSLEGVYERVDNEERLAFCVSLWLFGVKEDILNERACSIRRAREGYRHSVTPSSCVWHRLLFEHVSHSLYVAIGLHIRSACGEYRRRLHRSSGNLCLKRLTPYWVPLPNSDGALPTEGL